MNPGPLERPRDLGELLSDAFGFYARNLGAFLALSAAIVVPAQLIVSGVGLEQLTASYDPSPPLAVAVLPDAVSFLVPTPLVTAICIHSLRSLSGGDGPRTGAAITAGLEAFAPLFVAVVLAAAGIAVGLLLIVPGIYLAIRWFFVPQAVIVDGARGPGALTRSGALVQGSRWRTLGIVVAANVVATVPAVIIRGPLEALARSADHAAVSLAGEIVVQILVTPFVAVVSTLLYFDLRARGDRDAAF